MKKIGIIGLGAIGYPMAERLLEGGFTLYTTVRSDRSLQKAKTLGIHVLDSYKDFSKHVDKILILVSNYEQCKECLLGDDGIFSTFKKGIVIIASTVAPHDIRELASFCPVGVSIVDAPVSGGVTGAENGNLISITAGNRAAVDECESVFSCYCRKTFYEGAQVGNAQAIKAINQMLVGIHITATAEAMALSSALSVDPGTLYDVISESAGNSNMFQSRMPKLMAEDFSVRASLETLEKDTGICIDLAQSSGIPCFLTDTCHNLFKNTPRNEPNSEDACAVVRMYTKKEFEK